jgi:hypothetical protein
MAIIHFTFDGTKTETFIKFAYDLYCRDTGWIPPLKTEMQKQFAPSFMFYQKPGNSHRHFLATAGKKIVGRVSAMFNQELKDTDGTPVGTIGFFECIHDVDVARDLLDYSTNWLREEKGVRRIWGPMNFDIWHGYRFMTKGFDQKLFYGEPYNKAYYPDYFERYGFIAKYYWDSVEIAGRKPIEKMIAFGQQRYELLVDKGYRFTRLNTKRLKDDLKKFHSVLTRSFNGFVGFTLISLEEFIQLFEKSRHAFHPEFFTFIYDEKNVLAGFVLALLELSDAIRSMNGKDNWMSIMRFIYNRQRTNRINFYVAGITPEEERKKSGLGSAGLYFIVRQILNKGYNTVIFALMAKGNRAHKLLGEHAQEPSREYALFELSL